MRCFIAAEVSENAKDRIMDTLKDADMKAFRPIGKEHMHITLKFLGEVGDEEIEVCKKAIDECIHNKIPITLAGGGAFARPGHARVVFVNVVSDELERIARCIRNASAGIGDDRPFVGHLTVARARFGPSNASGLVGLLGGIEIREDIEKIALKKSTLTPQGPVYEDIYAKEIR